MRCNMEGRTVPVLAFVIIAILSASQRVDGAQQYFGKFLGKLTELHHGVSGEVYAVDGRTLYIKDFTYDGQGPAAYFYAGNSRSPSNAGFRIRDENGSPDVIRRYRKEGVTITLPEGKTLHNIKWFSIWCEEFEVNFGDVKIPRNFDYPKPQKVEGLRGVHGVSSDNIVLVDAQTLLIPNLSYDGEAPDAKFWVGRGAKPTPQGIRVPDENGKELPLRRYDRKTVVLTLPGDLTVFDIGHFGIWCEAFTVDFGHVQIPQNLNIPPSLKMLGVSPQSKLNCEVLYDDLAFEVRWAIAGDSIVLQLVSKLDNGEYMSFGLSGDDENSIMVGGDVAVAWVDKETLKGYAEDYFLDAKSQCSGPKGSCPDDRLAESSNNIRTLNAAMVNGYSIVTYQRPLKAADEFDRQIYTNKSQAIIWAIGPLNQRNEVSFHSHYTKHNQYLDFGRSPKWNCPMPEGDLPSMKPTPHPPQQQQQQPIAQQQAEPSYQEEIEEEPQEPPRTVPVRSRNSERRRGSQRQEVTTPREIDRAPTRTRQTDRQKTSTKQTPRPVPTPAPVQNRNAWDIPAIQCYEPEDGVFYAQMGPTGGKRGYPAITGHVGWGISWYINGLLIPEINVVRGKSYTFVVEGGLDPETPAKYHPFYITDDPVGGYEYKSPEEKQNIRIFSGAKQARDGTIIPTGVGRLCHWTHQGDSEADDFDSFGAYQRTLELKCDQGEPGVIEWTPDANTPDTVYYQCFTHRYLGWKINVLDSCDAQPSASEIKPVAVPAPNADDLERSEDLINSPSIIIETRVNPNGIQISPKNEADIFDKSDKDLQAIKANPIGSIQNQKQREPLMEQSLPALEKSEDFKPEEKLDSTTSAILLTIIPKKDNATYMVPPPMNQPDYYAQSKIMMRRPNPHFKPQLMKKTSTHASKPIRPNLSSFKKPQYRPVVKMPVRPPPRFPLKTPNKPMHFHHPVPARPQSLMIMKQQMFSKPKVASKESMHVEISPLQASTEREPETRTEKPYAPLLSVKPHKELYTESGATLPLAINTGFHPESVVIEGGFKPIISKEIDRSSDDGPELELESEIGMIDVEKKTTTTEGIKSFGPVFIPSPVVAQQQKLQIEKRRSKPKNPPVMFVLKKGRSDEETEDEEPAAAERVESYYLPPVDKKTKPIERPRKPSNIDIPLGTVVTYDGKRVSGASLTAKLADRSTIFESRSSKATDFIRTRPQFTPYKGELPPLDPKYIDINAPQLQQRGVLNRDLDTPKFSTKLSLIRQLENTEEDISDILNIRVRRAAHHTAEHTAEQEAQMKMINNSTSKEEYHHHDDHGHNHDMHHDHDHEKIMKSNSNIPEMPMALLVICSFMLNRLY